MFVVYDYFQFVIVVNISYGRMGVDINVDIVYVFGIQVKGVGQVVFDIVVDFKLFGFCFCY